MGCGLDKNELIRALKYEYRNKGDTDIGHATCSHKRIINELPRRGLPNMSFYDIEQSTAIN